MIHEVSRTASNVIDDLRPVSYNNLGKIWVAVLLTICGIGLFAYIRQLDQGLGITDMSDYLTWGIYVSNFVFFVAISLVGSLISAILKLSRVSWRTPLTRISEIIAVSAIIMAAITIIIDMGRPDRFYHVIIFARIQSPITWDVIVISVYLLMSLLLLYLPMIPDLAIYKKDNLLPRWIRKMYTFLALNWVGNKTQKRLLNRSIYRLAVVIIPVAFGIHTGPSKIG